MPDYRIHQASYGSLTASLTVKRHHLLMTQICYFHPPMIFKWEGMLFLSRSHDFLHIHHMSLPNLTFGFLFILCTTSIPSWLSFPGCRSLFWVSKTTSKQENVILAYFTFQLVILDSSICGRRVQSAEGLQFTANKLYTAVYWNFR